MAEKTDASGKRRFGYALVILGLLLMFILVIVKSNYDSQAAFLCENIEATGGNMLQCPVHKTDTSWFFMAGFGIALLIIAAGAYFGFIEKTYLLEKRQTPERRRTIKGKGNSGATAERRAALPQPDLSMLDPDSRKVFELLQSHEGSMFQSALVREAGFSKAKVTRILDRLEHEKILERRRRGMANLVILR